MSAFNSFLDFATETVATMQNFAEHFLKVHVMCISPLSRLTAISSENSNELVSLYLPCLSLGHFKIMALCWLLSSPLRFHLIYFEDQKYIKMSANASSISLLTSLTLLDIQCLVVALSILKAISPYNNHT